MYLICIVQRFEPQGRRFINLLYNYNYYYCYYYYIRTFQTAEINMYAAQALILAISKPTSVAESRHYSQQNLHVSLKTKHSRNNASPSRQMIRSRSLPHPFNWVMIDASRRHKIGTRCIMGRYGVATRNRGVGIAECPLHQVCGENIVIS